MYGCSCRAQSVALEGPLAAGGGRAQAGLPGGHSALVLAEGMVSRCPYWAAYVCFAPQPKLGRVEAWQCLAEPLCMLRDSKPQHHSHAYMSSQVLCNSGGRLTRGTFLSQGRALAT